MPTGTIRITTGVRGMKDLRDVVRELIVTPPKLQPAFNARIRAEASVAVRMVKLAWLTLQVTQSSRGGHGYPDTSTGLRRRTAEATSMEHLPFGAKIEVDGPRIDPKYGRALSWYLDNLGRQWQHPVFDREDVPWESQKGKEVFFKNCWAHEPAWKQGIVSAMENCVAEIERAGR
jgi:hypothetical protein